MNVNCVMRAINLKEIYQFKRTVDLLKIECKKNRRLTLLHMSLHGLVLEGTC